MSATIFWKIHSFSKCTLSICMPGNILHCRNKDNLKLLSLCSKFCRGKICYLFTNTKNESEKREWSSAAKR